jgi:hypothetical protein
MTRFSWGPGLPFDVRGLQLHYRPPFSMFVDVLERTDDGFDGRATVLGRELGTFTMRRIEMADRLEEPRSAAAV